jgi:hypothetical protein
MGKYHRNLQKLGPEQLNHLLCLFLATVLGSAATTLFIRWSTTAGLELEWVERLLVTLGAALIYALTVVLVFYVFSPRSRPALRRLFTRED